MTNQFNDGLDFGQGMSLLNEAQSAQNLLRSTVDAIVRLRHPWFTGTASSRSETSVHPDPLPAA